MTRVRSLRLTPAVVGTVLLVTVCPAASPEFRGVWVSRFEWPHVDAAVCKARIDSIMQTLAANNFNAVLFQIRGQCDVLYPSPYEVWSPLIGGADPGWDPLAYAINSAHANGLEFHAYINTFNCWIDPGGKALPANPNHTFYAHCNAADPAHRDWLVCDVTGTPVQWPSAYVWIAPGIPAFQAYWRQQVMHVVQNYAVDGVHFDYARNLARTYSHDPISDARRAQAQSNPEGLDFDRWTADQTTRLMCDIYAQIAAVKPHVKVSAAVQKTSATSPLLYHQDSLAWVRAGGMDMLLPMMYFSGGAGSTWDTDLQTWVAGTTGRHLVAGHSTSEGAADVLAQVPLARERGAQGTALFSYTGCSFWDGYASLYPTPAPTPEMPWKSNPTTGMIYGYVSDADGKPVLDAQVDRSGSTYKALSSADGLYSILLVPPGTYTVTASHPGYGVASVSNVSVAAGEVKRQDISLGELLPPLVAAVIPNPDVAERTERYIRQLTLIQGTVDEWTLVQGPPGASVNSTTGAVQWVPLPADTGHTFTFTVRATNAAGSDEESWSVSVRLRPRCVISNLAGFEEYANGARVVFKNPRSSSTSVNLATTPDIAQVTDAVPAFSGSKCYRLQWQYLDASPQRWARITTNNCPNIPNPIVDLSRPIRLRLRLDSGRLRLAIGIRETDSTGALGADGGTSGAIEFLGAASKIDDAPQGVLVEPAPGVWQTFTFDPQKDPIVKFTGDNVLHTETGKGVLECLAFSAVDSAGPFTVYLDSIDFLCNTPGDFDHDGDVDQNDFGLLQRCYSGPGVLLDGCRSADFNLDGNVDQVDFGAFQPCTSGPDQPIVCR